MCKNSFYRLIPCERAIKCVMWYLLCAWQLISWLTIRMATFVVVPGATLMPLCSGNAMVLKGCTSITTPDPSVIPLTYSCFSKNRIIFRPGNERQRCKLIRSYTSMWPLLTPLGFHSVDTVSVHVQSAKLRWSYSTSHQQYTVKSYHLYIKCGIISPQ